MVTYAEFCEFSNAQLNDFDKVASRAEDTLKALCGKSWDTTSEVCNKALMYQIETIALCGGLNAWLNGENAKGVSSHSFGVGSESESITYIVKDRESEQNKTFNGLAISPIAWAILLDEGILRTVRGVRVW